MQKEKINFKKLYKQRKQAKRWLKIGKACAKYIDDDFLISVSKLTKSFKAGYFTAVLKREDLMEDSPKSSGVTGIIKGIDIIDSNKNLL